MDDEGHPAIEERDLTMFNLGGLSRHQIERMLLNGIKRNEARIDRLYKRVNSQ